MLTIKELEYKEKLPNIFKELKNIKAIVLDSRQLESEKEILEYIKDNVLNFSKKDTIYYNYIIDTVGTIYKVVPTGYSGKCCKFNIYSEQASIKFPVTCPPTDARLSPRSYGPDEESISICLAYKLDNNLSLLAKPTKAQETSLTNLINNIILENNKITENGSFDTTDYSKNKQILLKSSDILLRSFFTNDKKEDIGHRFYNKNLIAFSILKRSIHILISSNKPDDITYEKKEI